MCFVLVRGFAEITAQFCASSMKQHLKEKVHVKWECYSDSEACLFKHVLRAHCGAQSAESISEETGSVLLSLLLCATFRNRYFKHNRLVDRLYTKLTFTCTEKEARYFRVRLCCELKCQTSGHLHYKISSILFQWSEDFEEALHDWRNVAVAKSSNSETTAVPLLLFFSTLIVNVATHSF